jgi:hypothetical protein
MRARHDQPVMVLEVFHPAAIGKNNSFPGTKQWKGGMPMRHGINALA